MELHELEIRDARAGAIGHRDAVAGRHRRDWWCRCRPAPRRPSPAAPPARAPMPASPSSCRKRAPTQRPSSTISDTTRACACAVTDGSAATRCHSVRPISRPVASAACSTRRALCAAFDRQRQLAVGVPIEGRAPLDQLAHVARAVLDQHRTAALVTQPVAGRQRVGRVQRRRIVVCRPRPRCRPGRSRCCPRADSALVSTRTRPAGASSAAARSPAMPLPMMRKSPCNSTRVDPAILPPASREGTRPSTHPSSPQPAHPDDVLRPSPQRPSAFRSTRRRATTRSRSQTGSSARLARRCLDCARGAGPALPRLEPAGLAAARRRLPGALSSEPPILIPDGERHKQLATVGRIYDALVRAGADRATTIVAVGGGVVGDIAGFAAATFLRGVPVVQVPTTLLAQVDSAIGGKVGVNHALGKNLIGAFHQPLAVVIDPDLLATLPRREFRAGLYEVVKYGMIASRPLFDRLTSELPAVFKREPGAARRRDRRVVPHQGRGRLGGRARSRAAPRPQLRPHHRPRARGGDQVQALPPWRGGRLRHAGGLRARGRRAGRSIRPPATRCAT